MDAGVPPRDVGANGCRLPEPSLLPIQQLLVLLHLVEGEDKTCARFYLLLHLLHLAVEAANSAADVVV